MVQEVAISFGRHLWRGNRATKVSSTNFGAFQSFNYPPLADMDLHIVFRERLLARPATGGTLAAALAMDDAVSVVFLYPGITEAVLRPQLESKAVKALVLRTFGAGNAPTECMVHRAYGRYGARGKGGRERDPVPCGRCGGEALRHR